MVSRAAKVYRVNFFVGQFPRSSLLFFNFNNLFFFVVNRFMLNIKFHKLSKKSRYHVCPKPNGDKMIYDKMIINVHGTLTCGKQMVHADFIHETNYIHFISL